MKQLKASTQRGKEIIRQAKVNEGYFLSDVYSTYSNEKGCIVYKVHKYGQLEKIGIIKPSK